MTDREQVIEAVADIIFNAPGYTALWDETELNRLATAALTAVLDATEEPTQSMTDAGIVEFARQRVTIDPDSPAIYLKQIWRAMHAALRRKLTGG